MLTQLNALFQETAIVIITVLEYLLLFRAIASWFPQLRGGKLFEIVHNLTEPIITPFRQVVGLIPGVNRLPIDLSFILAYLSLIVIELILVNVI